MAPECGRGTDLSIKRSATGTASAELERKAMRERTGGCLCGSIRYRLSGEPVISRICWCRDCQHLAGNGTANAIFPTDCIQIDGEPHECVSTAESGNEVHRRFCSKCGSHLFADNTGRAAFTVVRLGTLDDPSSIAPVANIWSASAPTWACLNPALQRVEKQPPSPQMPSAAQLPRSDGMHGTRFVLKHQA